MAGAGAALAVVAVIGVLATTPLGGRVQLPDQTNATDATENADSAVVDLSASAFADDLPAVADEDAALLSQVVVDGRPISEEAIAAIASADEPYASHMGQILQNDIGLPSGCEIVSLAMLLQSLGYDASPQELAKDYLVMDGRFATGYAGSPYGAGGGYPPGIVRAANAYLLAHGADAHAYDLTGSTVEGLEGLTSHGYPVLVWSTMYFEDPSFTGAYEDGAEWYSNEHCIVVYGIEGSQVMLSDPIEGYVGRPRSDFERIFMACGSMAATVI